MSSRVQSSRALDHPAAGLVVAVLSAAAFGVSGTFARPLLEAGWTPGAAVALRTAAAGAVVLPAALWALRGRSRLLWRAWPRVLAFGAVGVAGAQLCYFAAVERLPVGIAILIEFLGPVLLVIATSLASRAVPPRLTIVGAVVAIGGLFLVLDLTGSSHLDPVGIGYALMAAVCAAGYFHLAGQVDDDPLPPVALAAGGLLTGAAILATAGLVGVLPFGASTADVDLFGTQRPWWVPMAVIVLVATSFAYVTGVVAATLLGARVASFVALLEVMFAVVAAWVLLDEVPVVIQGFGGLLILVGVALVRLEGAPSADPIPLSDESSGLCATEFTELQACCIMEPLVADSRGATTGVSHAAQRHQPAGALCGQGVQPDVLSGGREQADLHRRPD